jgi:hypothetical protein
MKTYSVTAIYNIYNYISLNTRDDIVIVWIGTKSDSVIQSSRRNLCLHVLKITDIGCVGVMYSGG